MKTEHHFSKGERGKFYSPGAVFTFPVYLEPDVDEFLSKLAAERNLDIQERVNDWLRANIRVIESLGEQPIPKTKPRIAE